MPTQPGPIFFLTGAPGAGKSTVARALAQRFDHGIHIDIDKIRLMVASGIALHQPGIDNPEVARQLRIAHVAAGQMAKTYADEGFAVIADHCSHVPFINAFLDQVKTATVVALRPNLTVNQTRNLLRSSHGVNFASLKPVIEMLYESLPHEYAEANIPIIDTTVLTVEETVDQILSLS